MTDLRVARQIPGTVIRQQIIPAREYLAFTMQRGQVLRIIDLEGQQCADLIAFNLRNLEERIHNARAVRLNGSYKPTTGHMLYSDDCNPMFKIIADTLGENYAGDSMCSEEMNFIRYGVHGTRNCRDNLALAVQPWGITKHQLPGAFAPFMSVTFTPEGGNAIAPGKSRPGDYIDLKAEMDLLVAISNCPQDLNPINGWNPTALEIILYEESSNA